MSKRKFLLFLASFFASSYYIAYPSAILASKGEGDDHDDYDDDHDDDDYDDDHDDDDYDDDHDDDDYDDYDDDDHDQDKALKAVKSKRAIPYKKMLKIFRKDHSGKILDVSFGLKNNILLYRFKYINEEGHVRIIYYYASNGEQVKNADIIN